MHKVFRNLLTEQECDDLINRFNERNSGWRRSTAINSATYKVDTDETRVALNMSVSPDDLPDVYKDKIMSAVIATKEGKYLFDEAWSVNKYKAAERGHFYWHSDVLNFFKYHGDDVGKLTPEEIFIKNTRPDRAMSVSVALNNRSDYNGGQFVIDVGDGAQTPIDLNKGDAVVFTSETLHGVEDVTEGDRYALVIWLVDYEEFEEWNKMRLEQHTDT